MRQYCSVGKGSDYRVDNWSLNSGMGRILLMTIMSRPLWVHPASWIVYTRGCFLDSKLTTVWSWLLTLPQVKNTWSFASTPPLSFYSTGQLYLCLYFSSDPINVCHKIEFYCNVNHLKTELICFNTQRNDTGVNLLKQELSKYWQYLFRCQQSLRADTNFSTICSCCRFVCWFQSQWNAFYSPIIPVPSLWSNI